LSSFLLPSASPRAPIPLSLESVALLSFLARKLFPTSPGRTPPSPYLPPLLLDEAYRSVFVCRGGHLLLSSARTGVSFVCSPYDHAARTLRVSLPSMVVGPSPLAAVALFDGVSLRFR